MGEEGATGREPKRPENTSGNEKERVGQQEQSQGGEELDRNGAARNRRPIFPARSGEAAGKIHRGRQQSAVTLWCLGVDGRARGGDVEI